MQFLKTKNERKQEIEKVGSIPKLKVNLVFPHSSEGKFLATPMESCSSITLKIPGDFKHGTVARNNSSTALSLTDTISFENDQDIINPDELDVGMFEEIGTSSAGPSFEAINHCSQPLDVPSKSLLIEKELCISPAINHNQIEIPSTNTEDIPESYLEEMIEYVNVWQSGPLDSLSTTDVDLFLTSAGKESTNPSPINQNESVTSVSTVPQTSEVKVGNSYNGSQEYKVEKRLKLDTAREDIPLGTQEKKISTHIPTVSKGRQMPFISRENFSVVGRKVEQAGGNRSFTSKEKQMHYSKDFFKRDKMKNNTISTQERCKAMIERRIVYVGDVPDWYTVDQLKERFKVFGTIKDIQMKLKETDECSIVMKHSPHMSDLFRKIPRTPIKKRFGFITYSTHKEASMAIDHGNKGHELKLSLSFGGRRHYVGEDYTDLDGNVAKNENKNSSKSALGADDDYTQILLLEQRKRGLIPPSTTIKCLNQR
ncbi:uncharacterized protein TNCT_459561 [Trichonephila clavata]|uniref:RRM domain-containing protein n=1 Tax=Trichonephila clavata TaxID=2740835 RepID=A0A8X6F228_TRICU|nr:uncharacterized protein TNCT_459561 [Trichonephila clavata]